RDALEAARLERGLVRVERARAGLVHEDRVRRMTHARGEHAARADRTRRRRRVLARGVAALGEERVEREVLARPRRGDDRRAVVGLSYGDVAEAADVREVER